MAIDPDVQPLLDQLQAQIDNLRAVQQQHSQHFNDTGAHINALYAADKAFDRRITALENPTPPRLPIQFGYSDAGIPLATSLARGLKAPKITRVFNGSTYNAPASRFSTGNAVWLSAKLSQLTTATWGASVDSYVRATVPKTTKVYITAHHEPEGNRASTQTLEQWAAAWRQGISNITAACAKLRAEGWDVWSAPIICDWVFDPRWGAAANIDLWYPLDGSIKADVWGFDCYPQGPGRDRTQICCLRGTADFQVSPYADANAADTYKWVRLCAARAKALGGPWAIAECGVWRADRDSDLLPSTQYPNPPKFRWSLDQRARRFTDIAADLASLDHPPVAVCWYLDGRCVVEDTTTIAAINSTL